LADLESARIDLRVDAKAVEGGFFGGVRADPAPEAEGELDPVDVAIVGKVESLFWR
jgi:hypothetical protein